MSINSNVKSAAVLLQSMGGDSKKKADEVLLAHLERSRNAYQVASMHLMERLKKGGCNVQSLNDLKNRTNLGDIELDCLIDELEKAEYQPLIFDILAVLRVPGSRRFLDRLTAFWEKSADTEVRLGILNVLEVACLPEDMPILVPVFDSARNAGKSLERCGKKVASVINKKNRTAKYLMDSVSFVR
jgi:hypothetical protein